MAGVSTPFLREVPPPPPPPHLYPGVDRSYFADPNACVVVSEGTRFSQLTLALGTSHPACRVGMYGDGDPGSLQQAWLESSWTGYSEQNKLVLCVWGGGGRVMFVCFFALLLHFPR